MSLLPESKGSHQTELLVASRVQGEGQGNNVSVAGQCLAAGALGGRRTGREGGLGRRAPWVAQRLQRDRRAAAASRRTLDARGRPFRPSGRAPRPRPRTAPLVLPSAARHAEQPPPAQRLALCLPAPAALRTLREEGVEGQSVRPEPPGGGTRLPEQRRTDRAERPEPPDNGAAVAAARRRGAQSMRPLAVGPRPRPQTR